MTKQFERKIIFHGIVDTRKYRYVYDEYSDHAEIKRIPIEYLDRTAALDNENWEIIKRYEE